MTCSQTDRDGQRETETDRETDRQAERERERARRKNRRRENEKERDRDRHIDEIAGVVARDFLAVTLSPDSVHAETPKIQTLKVQLCQRQPSLAKYIATSRINQGGYFPKALTCQLHLTLVGRLAAGHFLAASPRGAAAPSEASPASCMNSHR